MTNTPDITIHDVIRMYDETMGTLDSEAQTSSRSYGGHLRSTKGTLVEDMCKMLVKIAWKDCGGRPEYLNISSKKVPIKANKLALDRLPTADQSRIGQYRYKLKVDLHVEIHNELVVAIECKAYTENAMLKRILTDFSLLKNVYPKLSCILFQLESQLGGDYSHLTHENPTGSETTVVLQSFFPQVELKMITLLEGERNIQRPIHKFPKKLEYRSVERAKDIICEELRGYANLAAAKT